MSYIASFDGSALIAPTVTITATRQRLTVAGGADHLPDGSGDQGPGRDALSLPGRRAPCMAENATHTLHSLLT